MATKSFSYTNSATQSGGATYFRWGSAANWQGGTLPTSSSDVVIDSAATLNYRSLDNNPNQTIDSLQLVATPSEPLPYLEIGSGDRLTVTGTYAGGSNGLLSQGNIQIDANAALLLTQSAANSGYFHLVGPGAVLERPNDINGGYYTYGGANEAIILTDATPGYQFAAPNVSGFAPGDELAFYGTGFTTGYSNYSALYLPATGHAYGSLTITGTNGAGSQVLYKINTFIPANNPTSQQSFGVHDAQIADPRTGATVTALEVMGCFAAGTRIATGLGWRLVEDLRAGDRVTVVGAGERHLRRVRWIGQRRLDLASHPRRELAAPVRFQRGSLAEGLPERDLLLSPDHCVLLNGKLVPAKLLVNEMTIVQELAAPSVVYFHVELDTHSVVLAEGVAAESYLESGNRGFFANWGEAISLFPELTLSLEQGSLSQRRCAPLARTEAEVKPIWRALVERAVSLGHTRPEYATITDPDLRLVVNGQAIRPTQVLGSRHVFELPPGASELRIVSRRASPADLKPYLDDWRRLGIAVSRIVFHRAGSRTEIGADHPGLVEGWHQPERRDGAVWRWTSGDARLEVPAGAAGARVEIDVHATITYRVAAVQDGRLVA